jgi:hypothetical protein
MTRVITIHHIDKATDLEVEAVDEPGPGGANHTYEIRSPSIGDDDNRLFGRDSRLITFIHFQEGPIPETGINGVTNEALLACVIDRLRSFQNGPFPCDENASALAFAESALHWSLERTHRRIAQRIEGTNAETRKEKVKDDGPIQDKPT